MFEFKCFENLIDDELQLVVSEKKPGNAEKKYVPSYSCHLMKRGVEKPVGRITLRVGPEEFIYHVGHIGYEVSEEYRGHGYAARACQLIKEIALAHHLNKVLITCNPVNIASRKTCENIGAVLKEIVDVPETHNLRNQGYEQVCVYEWELK